MPRRGFSARTAPAPIAHARTQKPIATLRINMPHLALRTDLPTGDGVEVVAGEAANRRRLRSLSALGHELLPGRLHVAAFVPRPALQDCRSAVPAPRHAESGKGLGQPRCV